MAKNYRHVWGRFVLTNLRSQSLEEGWNSGIIFQRLCSWGTHFQQRAVISLQQLLRGDWEKGQKSYPSLTYLLCPKPLNVALAGSTPWVCSVWCGTLLDRTSCVSGLRVREPYKAWGSCPIPWHQNQWQSCSASCRVWWIPSVFHITTSMLREWRWPVYICIYT